MPMPEATVDKDHLTAAYENKVGDTRKIATMQSEPIAEAMGDTPHSYLGLGVFGAYPRHALATRYRG
jgi:hypothetical protein